MDAEESPKVREREKWVRAARVSAVVAVVVGLAGTAEVQAQLLSNNPARSDPSLSETWSRTLSGERMACLHRTQPRRIARHTYVLDNWTECAVLPAIAGAIPSRGLVQGRRAEVARTDAVRVESGPGGSFAGSPDPGQPSTSDQEPAQGSLASWTRDRSSISNPQYDRSVGVLRDRFLRKQR